jgi:hypothetical protein
MNDVESFALVLSTISRSLVDLKGKNDIIKSMFIFLLTSFISSIT